MKVTTLLACSCIILTTATRNAQCSAIKAPLDLITMDDVSESDRQVLEYLEKHYHYPPRPKRSGGSDLLGTIAATIGQGLKHKLGQVAKSSVLASGQFSQGSSGGHSYHHDEPHHHSYDSKSFDFWTLKKSILNTLLQAVKAIKGGVIAIKGQLIKGSGYLVTAKGKLISAKGEALTNLGKNIATSAALSPLPYHHHHHHPTGHLEYAPPHDGHYSSAPAEYGSPSAPGPEYEVPEHYHSPHHPGDHEDKPDADHAGILILKKIPKDHHHDHESLTEDHHHHKEVPDFKPIEHSGPGFLSIVGKFLKASTSLTPGEPAPFGDTAPAHASVSHQHHHSHVVDEPEHQEVHHQPETHESYHNHHEDHQGHHEDHHGHHEDHQGHHEDHHGHHEAAPQSGGGFEQAPDYLNIDYSESKKNSVPGEPERPQFHQPHYDEVRQLSSYGYDPQSQSHSYDNSFGAFPSSGVGVNSAMEDLKLLAPPAPLPLMHNEGSFPSGDGFNSLLHINSPPHPLYQPAHHSNGRYPPYDHLTGSFSQKVPKKRPPRSKTVQRHRHRSPSFDVVRSVAFELGPNGPKRL